MAAFSDYLEGKVAQFMFKNNAETFVTPGDSLYVALFVGDDGLEAGTLTSEASGGAYARQQVAAAGWTQTGGAVENTADIEFPVATAAWGVVSHVAIMDAASGGNVLYHGALVATRDIGDGDQFKFNAGDLDVTHN